MSALHKLPGRRGYIDLLDVKSILPLGEYPDECTLVMKDGKRHSVGSGYNKTPEDSMEHWAALVNAAKSGPAYRATDQVLDLLVMAGHITREKAFQCRDIWRTCFDAGSQVPTHGLGFSMDVMPDPSVPPGEVWFMQDGKVVGRIIDVGVSPAENGKHG